MPVYEYECGSCSLRFEIRKGFTDNSDVICPRCNGHARRVFSPVPIIFKGSGFYVTDNRTEDTRKPTKKHSTEDKGVSTVKQPTGEKS